MPLSWQAREVASSPDRISQVHEDLRIHEARRLHLLGSLFVIILVPECEGVGPFKLAGGSGT